MSEPNAIPQAPRVGESPAPKVSVCTIAYNHEKYIEACVRGVFMQQCAFDFEMVIGDDCSTDGTLAILERLQQEFGSRLRILSRKQNLGLAKNFENTYANCRGEYTALCEGDDYWTDPLKLRKQIEALEANPNWSGCFHLAEMISEPGKASLGFLPADFSQAVLTVSDLLEYNSTPTCSIVYRRCALPEIPKWISRSPVGDWPLQICALRSGPIGYIPEVMAVYRIHEHGVWSGKPYVDRLFEMQKMFWILAEEMGADSRPVFEQASKKILAREIARWKEVSADAEALRNSPSYRLGGYVEWPWRQLVRLVHACLPQKS